VNPGGPLLTSIVQHLIDMVATSENILLRGKVSIFLFPSFHLDPGTADTSSRSITNYRN
jgi:hypothetical protein